MKPRSPIARAPKVARWGEKKSINSTSRRWQCRMCPHLNEGSKKKCGGCGATRRPSANAMMQAARKIHVQIVRPPGVPCFNCGTLVGVQDAHIFNRGSNRSPAVQWHPSNGMPLCKGPGSNDCHTKFDSYQLDREALSLRYLGAERYAELKVAATVRWNRDWPAVISRLKDALAQRKEAA